MTRMYDWEFEPPDTAAVDLNAPPDELHAKCLTERLWVRAQFAALAAKVKHWVPRALS